MTRTAPYARFSTEQQNDRSIEDQMHLCRTHAERTGLTVTATFSDRARSGASVHGRDGLMDILLAARAGRFDVTLVELLDRLSRDQEDLAGIWKRLTFAGIALRAVHEGTADQVQIGGRGLLGSLYLADPAHKVRRGMDGVVRDGRHAGGRAYGYRSVAGRPGELEIVETEAEVGRRIFYIDEIGHPVLAGLKEHLKSPVLLKTSAEEYRRERERLSADKRRARSGLEAKLAMTRRLLDRAWKDYETERLTTDIVGARVQEILTRQKELEAELAEAPADDTIVGLHPAVASSACSVGASPTTPIRRLRGSEPSFPASRSCRQATV